VGVGLGHLTATHAVNWVAPSARVQVGHDPRRGKPNRHRPGGPRGIALEDLEEGRCERDRAPAIRRGMALLASSGCAFPAIILEALQYVEEKHA